MKRHEHVGDSSKDAASFQLELQPFLSSADDSCARPSSASLGPPPTEKPLPKKFTKDSGGDEEVSRSLLGSTMPTNDVESNALAHCSNGRAKMYWGLSIVIVTVAVLTAILVSAIHTVDEGHVGIYFSQGALQDEVSFPGINWMAPFITTMKEISIRPQTDKLGLISAVTKDGIENRFNDVQVISDVNVNNLIDLIRRYGIDFKEALVFDRIREELRIFCANHTIDEVYNTMFLDIVGVVKTRTEASIARLGDNGITLLNLVIPKPVIPADIALNYKQVKVQWTEQLVATQQQKTEEIKKETESMKAVADANRQKAVLEIEIQKQIIQKEGDRDLSLLENEIVKKREESLADVANYKRRKEAEGNTALYTDSYLKLEMARALSNNTKFYFSGEQSALGALLSNIIS